MKKSSMISSNTDVNVGDIMKEIPSSTLPDETLDVDKCRAIIEKTLAKPEPEPFKAFDSEQWLADTKAQLKPHLSANQ